MIRRAHHWRRVCAPLFALGMACTTQAFAIDMNAALAALEFEAGRGDPAAQVEMATRLEHAEGVPRNLVRAVTLYCEAARAGLPEGQFRLGWMYANGRGVEREDHVASALFAMAASQGHAYAAKMLDLVQPRGAPAAVTAPAARTFGSASASSASAAAPSASSAIPSTLNSAPPPSSSASPSTLALSYVPANSDRAVALPNCLAPDPPLMIAATGELYGPPEPPKALSTELVAMIPRGDPEIERLVRRLAPRYGVDPELALAVIAVESDFNPGALSPKNAGGLMQLIPETAQRFGVRRVFNPSENVNGGLAYLRWLLAFFQGEVHLVLAAYNAGEGAVEKYRGIPPYAETRRYVQKVTRMYPHPKHPYVPAVVDPSPVFAALRHAGR